MPPPTDAKRTVTRTAAPAESYRDPDDYPDEDEPTTAPRRGAQAADTEDHSHLVGSGWEGAERVRKSMPTDFARSYKPGEQATIVKFFQDAPFATWKEHWCEWQPKGQKKSFVCLGDDCPLCAIGHRVTYKEAHNVIDMSDSTNPVNAVYIVGTRDSKTLRQKHNDERRGPINNENYYYEISRVGEIDNPSSWQTSISAVSRRVLDEEWGIEPLSAAEIAEFATKAFTIKQTVQFSSRRDIEAAVDRKKGD